MGLRLVSRIVALCAASALPVRAQTETSPTEPGSAATANTAVDADASRDTEAIEVELASDRLLTIPTGAIQLFEGSQLSPENWGFVSAKRDAKLGDTWTLITVGGEPVLQCSGQPFGLLRTNVEYANYRFGVEWRFVDDATGNSGLLVHSGSEQTVWPRAVQVQFHAPDLGVLAPVGGAKVQQVERRAAVKPREGGRWNSCIVSSNDGVLSVKINGSETSAVTGSDPRAGSLGFQSEGAVVQFRRAWILPESPPPTDSTKATSPANDAMPGGTDADRIDQQRSNNERILRNAVDVGWSRTGRGRSLLRRLEALRSHGMVGRDVGRSSSYSGGMVARPRGGDRPRTG